MTPAEKAAYLDRLRGAVFDSLKKKHATPEEKAARYRAAARRRRFGKGHP